MTGIAVLTSGGDSPGMNAAIRGITKVAASHGVPTWGVEQGFDGLIDGAFRPLSRRNRAGAQAPVHEVESEGARGARSWAPVGAGASSTAWRGRPPPANSSSIRSPEWW